MSVVWCQVEVSGTSWSLVQRSLTDCVVVCDLENLVNEEALAHRELLGQKETKPRNIRLSAVSIPITTAIRGHIRLSITLRRRWSWNSNSSYCPRLKGFTLYPSMISRLWGVRWPAACEEIKACTLHRGRLWWVQKPCRVVHGSGSYSPASHYGDLSYIPSKSMWVM